MEDIKILLQEYNKEIKEDIKEVRKDLSQEIKEELRKSEERFERHVGTLKEDFDSKVFLIGEQHNSIIKKLDSHTEMIGAMKEDIEVTKINVEFIKSSLKKKVDLEEFESLENRVSSLEAKAHS